MRAKIIALPNDEQSIALADRCIESSDRVENDFKVQYFRAITSDEVYTLFREMKLLWNYPWTTGVLDIQSGLFKSPYATRYPAKRMACFLSHFMLWRECASYDEPYIILEHDALFQRKLDLNECHTYDVISLNDPRGATRLSGQYHDQINGKELAPCPYIDKNRQTPQGLPGNSAYYITPKGAKKLIELVREYGAWPNDAIMCNQLMPNMLGCIGNYVTTIQRSVSTTTK